jgi:hypothetical protein
VADNLRISGAGDESVLEFGRDHSEKLQQLSRSVLSTLYMLVRSAKMYDPDNAVFERPLISLQDTLNLIIPGRAASTWWGSRARSTSTTCW